MLAVASDHDGVATAPVTFVATSTWWRNAWKYRDRTYRHAFWDSGTVLANLLATAESLSLPAEVVLGFADEPVVELLGVDPRREAPLELVPVGAGNRAPDSPPSNQSIRRLRRCRLKRRSSRSSTMPGGRVRSRAETPSASGALRHESSQSDNERAVMETGSNSTRSITRRSRSGRYTRRSVAGALVAPTSANR
ncbi:nitroreductase family protein [Saliphagus sp. GCM10025308]